MFESSFPNILNENVKYIENYLDEKNIGCKNPVWLLTNGESIQIPIRLYTKAVNKHFETNENTLIYACLMTRHHNGFVREKYLNYILNQDYPDWCIPYIIELSSEYVIEIISLIYNNLKNKNVQNYKDVILLNQKQFLKCYGKMVNYWFIGERYHNYNFKKYIGYKLYTEIFGFTREKDYCKKASN